MKHKSNFDAKQGVGSLIILVISFIATVIFGMIGYHIIYKIDLTTKYPLLIHWFDVSYSTLRLFSLYETPSDKNINHWAISLARLAAISTIFSSIALAAIYSIGDWVRSNLLLRFYKNHYVVLGSNKESFTLISDLLNNKHKVIIITENTDNTYIEQAINRGAAVINGDPTAIDTLTKASILKADAIIAMSDDDLENLAAVQTIMESAIKQKLTFFVRLETDTSYKLFEPDAYYSIENIKALSSNLCINTFNTSELIATDLVSNLHLGTAKNITDINSLPVSILIAGFGEIGQAIFKELLLMCHFCNGKKVHITIVNDSEENFFFDMHHQVLDNSNGNGLDLWDIEFIDNGKALPTNNLSDYDHIISAYEDDNKSLSTILKYYDLCTVLQMREEDASTTFHYYSTDKHDIKHRYIDVFGDVESVCNLERLVLLFDEEIVKKRHEQYTRSELGLEHINNSELQKILIDKDSHETNSAHWLSWNNQPLFKRRSNFTAYRHAHIKFQTLGGKPTPEELQPTSAKSLDLSQCPYTDEFPELNTAAVSSWFIYIMNKGHIDYNQLIERIDRLAKSEHNRWNAFHIVNNWRYGIEKNEKLKTHDCLLSWDDLMHRRPDTIKYDYKNIFDIVEYIDL